jgi:hypothetical protein
MLDTKITLLATIDEYKVTVQELAFSGLIKTRPTSRNYAKYSLPLPHQFPA